MTADTINVEPQPYTVSEAGVPLLPTPNCHVIEEHLCNNNDVISSDRLKLKIDAG